MTPAASIDLRPLADEGLAAAWSAADVDDPAVFDRFMTEFRRREQAERLARARERLAEIRAEGELAAHAQYLEASSVTRGRLLSREGMAAGINETDLWRMPWDRAARLMSEELGDYFQFVEPRITAADYVRVRAAEARMARSQAIDAAGPVPAVSDEYSNEESDSDERDADGAGLAGDEPGALRRDAAAEDPEVRAGAGWPVLGGGRGHADDAAPCPADAGGGRPAGHVRPAGGVRRPVSTYTTYADTAMAPITPCHLVPGFLEKGQVILITGQGGCGKSMLTAWWTAACTQGELPGCDGEPRSVGWVNAEDDPATSTAWRLRAAGADPSRVIDLTESEDGEPFELPRDIGRLRQAIDDNDLALVIIDPLSAVSSLTLSTVLSARKIMMPLQRAARETGCVIAVIHHETKQKGTVAGSKGLVDSVRMVLRVAPDDEVPSDRVLTVAKSNTTGDVAPARFTITGDGPAARVTWLDRDELTRRRTAWRKPALSVVPDPADAGRQYAALVSIQGPADRRPEVLILGRYAADRHGAGLARRRCEAHRLFSPGADWETAGAELLSRYELGDGTQVRFAVADVAN